MKYRIKTFIILIIILNYGCGTKQVEDESESAIVVQTTKSIKGDISEELEFSGTVFPNREANVGASLPGKVEKIHYTPGQYVTQGSLLISMSSEMLILADVEYKTLEKDFERVSRLREKGSISEQDYDHVKAKYEASEAKYNLIKKNTEITAPFSGIVSDIIVQEGENFMFSPSLDLNFSMTSGIIKLMQINPVLVRFPVNEKMISQIKIGDEVKIICDAYRDKVFSGKISLIYPKFSTITRTTDVEVTVFNSSGELKPGMYARIYIEGGISEGSLVPLTSIVSRKDKEFVWTVENGKAKAVEIVRLAMKGEYAVVSGINSGVEVVISRKSQLVDGVEVKASNK